MTTKEIQNLICKAEIRKGNLVAENLNHLFAGELDVCSVNKSGYVHELEVKISRADFKADAKKVKWQYYNDRLYYGRNLSPNYFSYVCPDGLIKPDELKPWVGLIYIKGDNIEVVRKPALIHKHKTNLEKLLRKLITVNNWKQYFGAQKLTLLNREAKENNNEAAKQKLSTAFTHIHERQQKYCFLNCQECDKCQLTP